MASQWLMQPCSGAVIDAFGLQSPGYFFHYQGIAWIELQCTASLCGHFTENLGQYSIRWFDIFPPDHQFHAWRNGFA